MHVIPRWELNGSQEKDMDWTYLDTSRWSPPGGGDFTSSVQRCLTCFNHIHIVWDCYNYLSIITRTLTNIDIFINIQEHTWIYTSTIIHPNIKVIAIFFSDHIIRIEQTLCPGSRTITEMRTIWWFKLLGKREADEVVVSVWELMHLESFIYV